MTFDSSIFDQVVNRRGSNSLKWSGGEALLSADEVAADPLPMWVADMDFRAPAPVLQALEAAVEEGVFGYPVGARPSYLAAVTGWQHRRFGWIVAPEWVVPTSGIIPAIKTAVQAFTSPGDTVLIQSPVYAHFRDDVLSNGRFPVSASLRRTEDGYRYDEAEFEAAIRSNTKLFILSNPHNPTGNVWSKAELTSMGDICARHGVLVFSDEIHQDLIMNPALRHTPFARLGASYAKNSITGTSATKTFNLAGLQNANILIPDRATREAFQRQYDRSVYRLVNVLGMVAAEAAYSQCADWADALVDYVRANHQHFAKVVNSLGKGIRVLPADSLYLAWMDCRELDLGAAALQKLMLTKARLWLDQGPKFGPEGQGYMRINLGCPRGTVDEAIERLASAL